MPNSAHLHLILNHFPVIGTMMVVLVLAYAVFINNDKIKKLGMFLLVLIGLITIPVFMTGDKAASIIKGNDGVLEEHIEPHEDFAKISMIAMEVTAGISLIALVLFRKERAVPVWFGLVLLLLIIGVNLMMVYTGHLGGRISHDAIMKHF
jgi:hypothetical protein